MDASHRVGSFLRSQHRSNNESDTKRKFSVFSSQFSLSEDKEMNPTLRLTDTAIDKTL
jgi:hypothetical protein